MKRIIPFILVLLFIFSMPLFAVKEPPTNATKNIESSVSSIDTKTPSDPSTVTEQDQTQALIGEVQATPTANTVLDRLKDIWDKLVEMLAVQTDATQKTQIVDGSGNVIGSLGNALNIHDADVHVTTINKSFINITATTSTLASGATAEDTVVTIQNADMGSFAVGDRIIITEGNTEEPDAITITAKGAAPPNTLTLDRPLDASYTTSAVVTRVEEDLTTTAGSLSSPVSYKIIPPADETWHVTRILGTMVVTNASSFNEFCSVAALANGLLIRENDGGTWKTLANWKEDSHIAETMFDLEDVSKAPAGKAGQRFRWTLTKRGAGATVKLEGANSDYLEVAMQDDLTGAIDCEIIHMTIQGHKEGE